MNSLQQTVKDLTHQLDDKLPQTQCTQCGFAGCLPYAHAMATGQADLNRCPPGGPTTVAALARILNKAEKPIDPECGVTTERHIANIDPKHCIGCTLCIKACPVDAIVGSSKRRHAVIADLCTGCELCIAPCPVDCIDMMHMPEHSEWTQQQALAARQRMHTRNTRLIRQKDEQNNRLESKAIQKLDGLPNMAEDSDHHKKRTVLETALARARARRAAQNNPS